MNARIDLPTWLTGAPSADDVQDYIDHGWSLVPIPPSTKGPQTKGWNQRAGALKSSADLPEGWGIGLAHAYSGTCALDIDSLATATLMLAEHGIDLQALLDAPDAVQIVSGREGRAKLLYCVAEPLPSKKITTGGTTIYELRCATSSGLTVQDVLPPSVHPDTEQPYCWAGRGQWSRLPAIPQALLDLWRSRLVTETPIQAAMPPAGSGGAVSDADWVNALQALQAIDPGGSRDEWITVGMALHSTGRPDALSVWNTWSERSTTKYPGQRDMAKQWASFHNDKATEVGLGSLFHIARKNGWVRPMPDASGLFGPTGGRVSAGRPSSLSIVLADELPEAFEPPDELIQGLLTVGDCSVWYGDSNTGKTFVLLDAACAVARGVPWFGRQVERGLVVYLAAESPSSVRSRIQAYQLHHGVKVPHFAIVQTPIDLFDGDTDTDNVVQVVKVLEGETGQKCRLIVGDTLARLSAGANENAGQDMGLVVRRIDRIRRECGAHVAVIHHSGKQAANGARGWSGIRAAVDTEVEVTDTPAGRCIEVTKQRDLPTKGLRIGFRLEPLKLGRGKWDTPVTSCVVVPSATPAKQQGKRLSEVGGAVVEFMRSHSNGIMKKDLVRHLDNHYTRSAIYREIKKLVELGTFHDIEGIIMPGTLFPAINAAGVSKA